MAVAGQYRKESVATEHPTTHDITWAAGIFEGEGYTKAVRRQAGNSFHFIVNVDQKDRWLCDRMKALFGGAVTMRKIKANSSKDPDLKREYGRWMISGSRALGFIQTIYKFLSPRRQAQVRLVLDAARS